ncbi:MAG: Crp/Fnr family transcriptional regulator [Planctomycetes bacterium]|nr:Crp/Fnr family transcriptional regulator [Planctomycetota bacterium]
MEKSSLREFPMFQTLSDDELEIVSKFASEAFVPKNGFVFREGDPASHFYFVKSGMVALYKLAPDGRERILHTVREGQSFAEAAIFGQAKYPAFARAPVDALLIRVSRDGFLESLRDSSELGIKVIESLVTWMRRLLAQLEAESFLSARDRFASFLLRNMKPSATGGYIVTLTEKRKDIAGSLGIAPETFSRAQKELADAGLIVVRGNEIEVDDPDLLENYLLGG